MCNVDAGEYLDGWPPVCACAVLSATETGERKLFADLFTRYVPEVRPRIDPTQNVTVTVDLDLSHVKQMVVHHHIYRVVLYPFICCLKV